MFKHFRVRRKGIGTILGAAYFIIIVLAIFNLIMWEFNQYDAYKQVVSQMNQVDQDKMSERLEFPYPVIQYPINNTGSTYDLLVLNSGGISVSVARIYVYNLSSNQLWILEKNINFTNGFINPGEINHKIRVVSSHDMRPKNASQPMAVIYLATERGRTFSTSYPITVSEYRPPGGVNVGWLDIGPLRFIMEHYSLNYTTDTVKTPTPAWNFSYVKNTPIMFFVKVINIATDSPVILKRYCVFQAMELTWQGASGKTSPFYIVDTASEYPGKMYTYDEINKPYILPIGDPKKPSGGTPMIIKFGSASWGITTPPTPCLTPQVLIGSGATEAKSIFLVLMGFYYLYRGQDYGVTIPFVAIRTNTET